MHGDTWEAPLCPVQKTPSDVDHFIARRYRWVTPNWLVRRYQPRDSHTNKTTGSFIHPVGAGSTSSDRVPALLHRIDLCWMAAVDAAYDACINISRSRRCCCVDRAISSRLATILLGEGWTMTVTRSLDALAVTINIKSRFRCGSRARTERAAVMRSATWIMFIILRRHRQCDEVEMFFLPGTRAVGASKRFFPTLKRKETH